MNPLSCIGRESGAGVRETRKRDKVFDAGHAKLPAECQKREMQDAPLHAKDHVPSVACLQS